MIQEKYKQEYIYIIRAGLLDVYKLGITQFQVEKRIASLQTGNHLKLSLVRLYRSPVTSHRYLERVIHGSFVQYHLLGEWYECSMQIIARQFNTLAEKYNLILERKYDQY